MGKWEIRSTIKLKTIRRKWYYEEGFTKFSSIYFSNFSNPMFNNWLLWFQNYSVLTWIFINWLSFFNILNTPHIYQHKILPYEDTRFTLEEENNFIHTCINANHINSYTFSSINQILFISSEKEYFLTYFAWRIHLKRQKMKIFDF